MDAVFLLCFHIFVKAQWNFSVSTYDMLSLEYFQISFEFKRAEINALCTYLHFEQRATLWEVGGKSEGFYWTISKGRNI